MAGDPAVSRRFAGAVQVRTDYQALRTAAARARLVDRATGLIAGRFGSDLAQAEARLRRLAAERGEDPADTAAAVLETAGLSGIATAPPPGLLDPANYLRSEAGPAVTLAGDQPEHRAAPAGEPAPDVGDLATDLLGRLAERVGAAAVIVMAVQPDGSVQLLGSAGVPARLAGAWQRLPGHLDTPIRDCVRFGREVWLPDLATARLRYTLVGDPEDLWPSRAWFPVRQGGPDSQVVAAIGALWTRPDPFDAATRRTARDQVGKVGARLVRQLADRQGHPGGWTLAAQAVLDMLPGALAVLTPVRDRDDRIVDYRIEAASPEATDSAGRRSRELVGHRVLDAYPAAANTPMWDAYAQVLADGTPREVGPFLFDEAGRRLPPEARLSVLVHRWGTALLVRWVLHDDIEYQAERLAYTERLGSLGWGEWDLTGGGTAWSDNVYQILERPRAAGPANLEELTGLVVPEDVAILELGLANLAEHRRIDVTFRVGLPGGVKWLRTVGEAVVDTAGVPTKIYGIVQDVTAAEHARRELHYLRADLSERRRALAAEQRVTARLQEMILPLPEGPVSLPGLAAAVRYQPAQAAARVGGDWFDLRELPDGHTLVAIGDMAGHGLAAAAAMTTVRNALVGLTAATSDPTELLGYLNRLLCDDRANPTGSALIGRYDPDTGRFRWATAGHPAPVAVRADGEALLLDGATGPLLGAWPGAVYDTAETYLEPGDTILLYTDGLVETRTTDIITSMRALADWLTGRADLPLTTLLKELEPVTSDDDTCVVAIRRVR
ncbi:SpoIIE family protein phosphatase [Longispora sp. K20-0274]|uniref:PP2C family protein-serine/threonine phosphatase n=1 Tax=Longispora sp. K20-0274 TaxID=3088255 RepID=UPI00399A969B